MINKQIYKGLLMGLVLFITATACNSDKKFDKVKWSYGDGLDFPLRDELVNDLVKNHKLKGLTYRQVIDSLGFPQNYDTLQTYYQVLDNRYVYNRKKPVHIKRLVFHFSKDSVVTKAEIYDYTEKKKK